MEMWLNLAGIPQYDLKILAQSVHQAKFRSSGINIKTLETVSVRLAYVELRNI